MLVVPANGHNHLRQDEEMSDYITVRGFVATDVKTSTTTGGVATASFRLASTTRRYIKESGTWADGQTNWFNVQGYRQLAGNLACSVRKGQPVIVIGKLKLRSWERDGRTYHATEIDADAVGHDLQWGSANYIRNATKPVLSLVEQDGTDDAGSVPGADRPFDAPEESEGGPGDFDETETLTVEERDGALSSLDANTGELTAAPA
jgi:single-strand DNA-binding protein